MTPLDTAAQALWDAGCREDYDVRLAYARACLLSVLPVSDGVVEAMRDVCYPNGEGHDLRFTAAIHHIVNEGKK